MHESSQQSGQGRGVIYRDERFTLGKKDKTPYLTADGKTYVLSCHPYEPCTYVKDDSGCTTAIHNAFDPSFVLDAFSHGQTIQAITGKVYTPQEFCDMIVFAAEHLSDTDISYVEGAIAVQKLKALGATSPENAVNVKALGVRVISERFSHSKKLTERVMYTEDGKVYVRIKG